MRDLNEVQGFQEDMCECNLGSATGVRRLKMV